MQRFFFFFFNVYIQTNERSSCSHASISKKYSKKCFSFALLLSSPHDQLQKNPDPLNHIFPISYLSHVCKIFTACEEFARIRHRFRTHVTQCILWNGAESWSGVLEWSGVEESDFGVATVGHSFAPRLFL